MCSRQLEMEPKRFEGYRDRYHRFDKCLDGTFLLESSETGGFVTVRFSLEPFLSMSSEAKEFVKIKFLVVKPNTSTDLNPTSQVSKQFSNVCSAEKDTKHNSVLLQNRR